tara:strand:- start:57 stop:1049 length:993 start_codon:yes stop_codon:yes gene_type:complete
MKKTILGNPKIVITVTGPLLKYRLDIIREVSPNIKDYLIIFTDRFSYDLYHEHHDFFNFVLMDEYRNKNPFSLKYERFPDFKTEAEFLEKFDTFYGNNTGVYYPHEVHRFVFDYLIENNILNFVITQSDFIFQNDSTMIKEFFDNIPQGTLYGPTMGNESQNSDYVWNSIQEKFPLISLKYDKSLISCDGFLRGFFFNNICDMKLFYNIWNEAIQIPIKNKYRHASPLYFTDFIVPTLMQFFAKQKNYNFCDMYKFTFIKKMGKDIGRHYTRVEDTLYMGEREGWKNHNFDYSDTSTVSNFIENNKERLIRYYEPFNTTATNKHVYTRMK